MNLLEHLHTAYVYSRRASVLCDHLAKLLPQDATVLDVGCGDGLLSYLIMQKRPDVDIKGVDILRRSQTQIPMEWFDGEAIPYDDRSFEVTMFIDVLHHTMDPMILLREAARVARKSVVIKDHTCEGLFDNLTLRLMDQVGNARHGVALPYNYWSQQRWFEAVDSLGLKIATWQKALGLYPRPARWLFDRSLHFISRLDLN
jgi:ubiquinone/menaquinone biosynthesis C-methylase UbiE